MYPLAVRLNHAGAQGDFCLVCVSNRKRLISHPAGDRFPSRGSWRRSCVPNLRVLRRGDHWSPAKRLVHSSHWRAACMPPLQSKQPFYRRGGIYPARLFLVNASRSEGTSLKRAVAPLCHGGLRSHPKHQKPALREARNGDTGGCCARQIYQCICPLLRQSC